MVRMSRPRSCEAQGKEGDIKTNEASVIDRMTRPSHSVGNEGHATCKTFVGARQVREKHVLVLMVSPILQ